MPTYDKADLQRRMNGAVDVLKNDLGGLRTGRASTALLDHITVEVYGSHYGLAHNPAVLHVLADRLAQPEHRWRAFAPGVLVRHAYP